MSVRYEQNEHGIFWVEDGVEGEPQKDLRHAMDDYELTASGRKELERDEEQRIHTGGAGEGQEADSSGDAG